MTLQEAQRLYNIGNRKTPNLVELSHKGQMDFAEIIQGASGNVLYRFYNSDPTIYSDLTEVTIPNVRVYKPINDWITNASL